MSLTSSSELMKGHNAVAGHPWLQAAEPATMLQTKATI
jgi:hypothetical protein